MLCAGSTRPYLCHVHTPLPQVWQLASIYPSQHHVQTPFNKDTSINQTHLFAFPNVMFMYFATPEMNQNHTSLIRTSSQPNSVWIRGVPLCHSVMCYTPVHWHYNCWYTITIAGILFISPAYHPTLRYTCMQMPCRTGVATARNTRVLASVPGLSCCAFILVCILWQWNVYPANRTMITDTGEGLELRLHIYCAYPHIVCCRGSWGYVDCLSPFSTHGNPISSYTSRQ